MHGVTESRPVTVRMEARPWRSGNKTTELGHQVGLDEIGLLMEGAQHTRPSDTISATDDDTASKGGSQSSRAAPLQVRCGLNAGEPIEEEGDLFGATVILASRIAARA